MSGRIVHLKDWMIDEDGFDGFTVSGIDMESGRDLCFGSIVAFNEFTRTAKTICGQRVVLCGEGANPV